MYNFMFIFLNWGSTKIVYNLQFPRQLNFLIVGPCSIVVGTFLHFWFPRPKVSGFFWMDFWFDF